MWQKIAKVSDVEEGGSQQLPIGERQVALFKSAGGFYALDGFCPHRGGPIGQGHLEAGIVTCPWHAWTFDIKTGECQNVPGTKQKCFPVKVEGEDIYIDA